MREGKMGEGDEERVILTEGKSWSFSVCFKKGNVQRKREYSPNKPCNLVLSLKVTCKRKWKLRVK